MSHFDPRALLEDAVKMNRYNWVSILQNNAEFCAFVANSPFSSIVNISRKDLFYAAAMNESPLCPQGKMRTLENAIKGWKGCGKAGACACVMAKLKASGTETKRRKIAEIKTQAAAAVVTDDAMDRLLALVSSNPSKQVSILVSHDAILTAFVNKTTLNLPGISIAERIFITLHGDAERTCDLGKTKTFNTLDKGYRFCKQGCDCDRANQRIKMTVHQASLTPVQKNQRVVALENTCMLLYGTTNPMFIPGVAEKRIATSQVIYGFDHPSQSPEIQERMRVAMNANHGVDYPGQSPEIMAKKNATNLKRYGKTHTMDIAREAFKVKNGVANPFEMKKYQDKAAATMFERFGVVKALQHPEVLSKMIAATEKKWGFPNVLMVPAIQQRIATTVMQRYNGKYVNQDHISDAAYVILQDGEAFRKMFLTKSLREISLELGLSYDGCRKYCDRHGVELPRSSYEEALAAFLKEYVDIERGDRAIIAPYEIDILIPSLKIGIEFCGLYWHGDKIKADKNYHLKKLEAVNAAGYRLITIFEDEWLFSREIVKSRLLYIMGMGEKGVGARKTTIRKISSTDAGNFCDVYHIQGAGRRGFANYGAFYQDTMVAVMTFGKSSVVQGTTNGPTELLRFATDGRSYPGVASRLFNAFIRDASPSEVVSFADRRWSDGGLYSTLSFTKVKDTDANYWYVAPNKVSRDHRWKFRKSEIINSVPNGASKSEAEIMVERGYYRIWDCGSMKFLWKP